MARLGLLAPSILVSHLRFLFRGEIIGNVKGRPDIIRGLALDHTRNRRTGQVQERLDIHIVGRQNEFKQQDLLQLYKVGVPLLDNVGHDLTLERFLNLCHGLFQVMLAKLNDLLKDLGLDVGERNLNGTLFVVVCSKVSVIRWVVSVRVGVSRVSP